MLWNPCAVSATLATMLASIKPIGIMFRFQREKGLIWGLMLQREIFLRFACRDGRSQP